MRTVGTVLVLAVLALGAACSSRKEPAEAAVTRIENELNGIRADAQKYAPDQLQTAETLAGQMKAALDKKDYGSVLGTLPQMNAELRTLHATVDSAKAEAEDLAAAARDEWNDLNASVPPLVEKLQARVNELSKSRKYPKGMDKAKFEEARTGFEALKSEWTEASSEFAAGEAGNAVRKARDAKAKAEELMTQLEVKA
ncbi:MAG TPA: hypothetical protein VFV88_02210 [Steroidobacteraceae bacterium]|jgi:hypothetical protein|nr:hypothetical protein [Steroidobacteraceae bacterium]